MFLPVNISGLLATTACGVLRLDAAFRSAPNSPGELESSRQRTKSCVEPQHSTLIEGICHAFAAAPCQAANVHAAFAAGSRVIEWAMPHNPLRTELLIEPWKINGGKLQRPELPGLGIALTEEALKKYAYIPGTANPGNFR